MNAVESIIYAFAGPGYSDDTSITLSVLEFRAALAALPEPATWRLDVERLARAYAVVTENSDTAWVDDPDMQERWRIDAADIAAEYARLASSAPRDDPKAGRVRL